MEDSFLVRFRGYWKKGGKARIDVDSVVSFPSEKTDIEYAFELITKNAGYSWEQTTDYGGPGKGAEFFASKETYMLRIKVVPAPAARGLGLLHDLAEENDKMGRKLPPIKNLTREV